MVTSDKRYYASQQNIIKNENAYQIGFFLFFWSTY